MEYTNFVNLCKYLGDQSLPEADRWKSLKYINISGQAIPGFDFQMLLRAGRINFITNTDVGPGFVILDSAYSDMGITNISDPVLTFIPLGSVDSFTFVVTKKPSGNDKSITINEIVEDIIEGEYTIPVAIKFTNSLYHFKVGDSLKFPVIFSKELTTDDYDLEYQDSLGNKLDAKPESIGEYYLIITCKNGYVGTAMTRFDIQ